MKTKEFKAESDLLWKEIPEGMTWDEYIGTDDFVRRFALLGKLYDELMALRGQAAAN